MIGRRLFTFASAASLLLCVATIALWAWSYHRHEVIYLADRQVGPPVGPADRGAIALYAQQGWAEARERYWKETRHELHVSRGRVATGTFDDWCVPRRAVAWSAPSGRTPGRTVLPVRDLPPLLPTGGGIDVTGGLHLRRFRTLQPSWPIWPAAAATLALPSGWAWTRWLQRRRRKRGGCPACGYDLRATPDLCPECGAVPNGQPALS